MSDEVWCARLGQVPYEPARELQRRLEEARRRSEVPDLLLLLEHPPVYTKGRRSQPSELGMGEDWYRMQGIEVCESDRGGAVTYHGPGQLVGYPIVSLQAQRLGVAAYIERMEGLMIESLASWGIPARLRDGLTGVWAGDRKIGSIGVHVRRGITTHGFAVNVNNDLQPFEWIVPCGIEGCRMTSVCRELGAEQPMDEFMDVVADRFGQAYGRRMVDVDPGRLDATAALA
jgi:lipoyl(octanoyl) transferase